MKVNRKIWIVLSTVIGLAFLFSTLPPVEVLAAEKPIKWKMANLYPRGNRWVEVYHGFVENVHRMSGGRLVIEEMYSGEGVAGPDVFNAVKTGLVEMGAPFQGYSMGELPFAFVEWGLPGMPSELDKLRTLIHEKGWKEVLREAYGKHNVFWLAEYYQPGVALLTKKEIKSVEDLKGLKIRAPGPMGRLIRLIGAVPVNLDYSEVYTSLATGVIDGYTGGNIVDIMEAKFFEVAKYLYPYKVTGYESCPIIVNMDAWKKLPEDLKAILELAALWHGDMQATKGVIWSGESYRVMKEKGLKMSPPLSDADLAKWRSASDKLWSEYEKADEVSIKLLGILREFMKETGE